MNEDVGASGASALTTGHMSDHMSSRIAVVGGRVPVGAELAVVALVIAALLLTLRATRGMPTHIAAGEPKPT